MKQRLDKRVLRSDILWAIRKHFYDKGFVETETPTLVLSPGMEPHIRPLKITGTSAFLHTSPEFAMKRVLSQGYPNLFQICKAYRLEPTSQTHHPEFTMLEWYRANSGYEKIMEDVEDLFADIAIGLFGKLRITTEVYGLQKFHKPWPRITIEECFRKFAKLELRQLFSVQSMAQACVEKGYCGREFLDLNAQKQPGVWDELFFRVMMNDVEPQLAKMETPVIIYRYPESQAALSNLETDPDGTKWAKRFEVYAGGLEIANAFDELADPIEQRSRFEKDMRLRQELYGPDFPPSPVDEEFLRSLEKLPATGGIALGVDRLVMYFLGARDIREVLWQEAYLETQLRNS